MDYWPNLLLFFAPVRAKQCQRGNRETNYGCFLPKMNIKGQNRSGNLQFIGPMLWSLTYGFYASRKQAKTSQNQLFYSLGFVCLLRNILFLNEELHYSQRSRQIKLSVPPTYNYTEIEVRCDW